MSSEIREWADQLPVGELFDLDDVQRALPDISRDATKASLSRLSKGDDPLIARACRGIYARRLVGGRYKTRLPINARRNLPWRLAGPGAGVTGPYVINMFGWSTQVSPRLWVAMLERRQALSVVATECSVDVLGGFPVVEFAGHVVEAVTDECELYGVDVEVGSFGEPAS